MQKELKKYLEALGGKPDEIVVIPKELENEFLGDLPEREEGERVAREVYAERGWSEPIPKEEIEAFLAMSCDEEW